MNHLRESVKESTSVGGGKYRIRLIGVGEGSSGTYSAEVLQEYGPMAWPQGTHCFMNHPTENEMWDRPEGDVTKMIGVLTSTPTFESDGLYADMKVFSHYAPLVEEVFPYVGMSIKALQAAIDPDTGDVLAILPHPLNSVDMVTVPGADGAIIEKITESFQFEKEKEKEIRMDKEIREALDAQNEKLDTVIAVLTEAAKGQEENEAEVVDLAEAVELLVKADLPDAAVVKVIEAFKNGADLAEAVETEKQYIKNLTSVQEAGALREQGSSAEGKANLGRFLSGKGR